MKLWAPSTMRRKFPADLAQKAKAYREQLIEAVAESDDHLV